MLKDALRKIRKERRITQDEVATFLGVMRQTYSAYERGVSMPDALTLKKLADYFEVTTDYFFGGINPELDSAQNPQEEKLLLLARRTDQIPPQQREKLIKSFEDNIDLYLEAMGLRE